MEKSIIDPHFLGNTSLAPSAIISHFPRIRPLLSARCRPRSSLLLPSALGRHTGCCSRVVSKIGVYFHSALPRARSPPRPMATIPRDPFVSLIPLLGPLGWVWRRPARGGSHWHLLLEQRGHRLLVGPHTDDSPSVRLHTVQGVAVLPSGWPPDGIIEVEPYPRPSRGVLRRASLLPPGPR